MMKRLTTTLSAAAVALAGLVAAPAPARADEEDLIKLLLGAAAVGLIVTEANRRGAFTSRAAPPPFQGFPQQGFVPPGHRSPPGLGNGRRDDWRDDWRDGNRDGNRDVRLGRDRVVPASCLFDLPGHYGPRPVVGARCVQGWDKRAAMPPACLFEARTGRGERQVYGLECLRDRGYRVVRG